MRYVAYSPSLLRYFPGELLAQRETVSTVFDDDCQVLWWPF